MEHLFWDLGIVAGGARFAVDLSGSTARVCLMDADNYRSYLDGGGYDFHGGFFDVTPVVLDVPYDHHWYLIVDSNPEQVVVEVTQIFD